MYETTLYMPHVSSQPPTHHPMQVPMGNQYRVSLVSHLTTRSLCDIYSIVSCLFGQQNFPGSHLSFWAKELSGVSLRVSYTLRHFLGFHRWIRCLTRFSGFSPERGVYPLLATPDTIHFPFSFNTVELNWTSSHSQAHTIQHQTQCQISTMYTHPCNVVLPHTNAMQFVPLHSNP